MNIQVSLNSYMTVKKPTIQISDSEPVSPNEDIEETKDEDLKMLSCKKWPMPKTLVLNPKREHRGMSLY